MKKAVVLLLLVSSCESKQSAFEKELTAKSNYWLYLRPESIGQELDTVYLPVARFSTDKTYESVLLRNGKTEPMMPYIDGSNTHGGKWKYNSIDSTIIIDNNIFKIKSLHKDTIYLVDGSSETHLLVKKSF
jgi:hypothetical protein